MSMLKHVLVFCACIMVSVSTAGAEEKSWYEIDGIKFRYGEKSDGQALWMDGEIIASTDQQINKSETVKFPIAITLSMLN